MSLDTLFHEERTNRLNNDHMAQMETFKSLLQTCKSPDDVLVLTKLLTRKKNQIKITVRWLIDHLYEKYKMDIEQMPKKQSSELPIEHVNFFKSILEDVIEGKLFLEQERRDFAVYLRDVYEKYGNIEDALKTTYDVPIETFSTLPLKDIATYQIGVFRLSILCRDKLRAEIMNRKIKEKWLNEEQKHVLYFLRVDYFFLTNDYYQAALEIQKLISMIDGNFDTSDSVEFTHFFELKNNRSSVLNNILCQQATFLLLISPLSEKRLAALKTIKMSKFNNENTRNLINSFIGGDLVDKEKSFLDIKELSRCGRNVSAKEYFSIIESSIRYAIDHHNISILSKYFSNIQFQDLESLTMTPVNIILEHICEDINKNENKQIKIDQKREIVFFKSDIEAITVEKTLKQLDSTVMWVVKERLRRKMMGR